MILESLALGSLASALAASMDGLPKRSKGRFTWLVTMGNLAQAVDEGYIPELASYLSNRAEYWMLERHNRTDIKRHWEGDSIVDPGVKNLRGDMRSQRTIEPGVVFEADLKHPQEEAPNRLYLAHRWNTRPNHPESMMIQVSFKLSGTGGLSHWNFAMTIDPPASLPWDEDGKQRVYDGILFVLQKLQSERQRRREAFGAPSSG